MKKNKKRGFTIVELVIVVAVIGILSAILIPTFIDLSNRANIAADSALVTNINKQLAISEVEDGKNKTMFDALQDAETAGYKVANINARSANELVWDQELDRFALLDKNGKKIAGETNNENNKIKLWKIYSSMPQVQTYSIYAGNNFNVSSMTNTDLTVGFDAGENNIESINYVRDEQNVTPQNVIIRTNGDQCVLTINAQYDNVDFYGFAKEINVTAVKEESLHIYGAVNELAVNKGHVKVEDTGIIFNVSSLDIDNASITNNGYIASKSPDVDDSVVVSSTYEVGTLSRLEAFRDAVNAGNNFKGLTVKLTANIALNDGWTPIGEGNRDVAATNTNATGLTTYFVGTFDGQNHTITNLNNKGFIPNSNRITNESKNERQYAYGLFALVGHGATIRNLTISNVDIDTTRYTGAKGDSVAALVGYANGSLTVENVTILNGFIKASDSAAGIVGRMYAEAQNAQGADLTQFTVSITNCTNNASIQSIDKGGKTAGILAMVSDRAKTKTMNITVSSCANTGSISAINTTESYAAGIWAYQTRYNTSATYTITNCTTSGDISAQTTSQDANSPAHPA